MVTMCCNNLPPEPFRETVGREDGEARHKFNTREIVVRRNFSRVDAHTAIRTLPASLLVKDTFQLQRALEWYRSQDVPVQRNTGTDVDSAALLGSMSSSGANRANTLRVCGEGSASRATELKERLIALCAGIGLGASEDIPPSMALAEYPVADVYATAVELGSPPPSLEARVLATEVRTLASLPPASVDTDSYVKYMGNVDSALSRLAVLGQPAYTRQIVEAEFIQLFLSAIRNADSDQDYPAKDAAQAVAENRYTSTALVTTLNVTEQVPYSCPPLTHRMSVELWAFKEEREEK